MTFAALGLLSGAAAIRNPWTVARYDIKMKQPAVYILASKRNGTLHIGVTSDLIKRGWEHRNDLVERFTGRYHVHRLVYFEQFESMISAIEREKGTEEMASRVEDCPH